MAGLAVKVDLARAVREAQAEFERFGLDRFPRAVQFAPTGVAIEATNRFREDIPTIWHAPNRATRDALRYVVDKDLLGKVVSVGEAKADVFVQDMQSMWLKFSFGDGPQRREPGDVGIEAYFGDQASIRIPVNSNLKHTGLASPGANGKLPGRDAKRVAELAAAGYTRNTFGSTKGSASWGVFEVKPGDAAMGRGFITGPGIYARPPRGVEDRVRVRVRDKMDRTKRAPRVDSQGREIKVKDRRNPENRYSLLGAPTTTFTRGNGSSVTVPKVVNLDTPRMLFLSTPEAEYQPAATESWTREMLKAAESMGDRLAAELADRLDHLAKKRR